MSNLKARERDKVVVRSFFNIVFLTDKVFGCFHIKKCWISYYYHVKGSKTSLIESIKCQNVFQKPSLVNETWTSTHWYATCWLDQKWKKPCMTRGEDFLLQCSKTLISFSNLFFKVKDFYQRYCNFWKN